MLTRKPLPIVQSLRQFEGRRVYFDGEMIVCRNQVLAAVDRASRAFDQECAIAKDWGIEVLLHLTGTHQIKEAMELVNVRKDTKIICIVQDSPIKPHQECLDGLPKFQPTKEILERYDLGEGDPCMQVLAKGVDLIVNHE